MTIPNSNPVELKPCHACGKAPIKQTDLLLAPGSQAYNEVAICNNYSCWMFGMKVSISNWNTRANELPSKPEQPLKVKSAEEFAYQMLGTIDATALKSRFKSISTIIEERDSQLRIQSAKAALTRAIEELNRCINSSCRDAGMSSTCERCNQTKFLMGILTSLQNNLRIEDL